VIKKVATAYARSSRFSSESTNITFAIEDLQNTDNVVFGFNVKSGKGNRAAIIWENGENERPRVLTYNELLFEVRRFAGALKAQGVKKGDRVTIYMPMILWQAEV
jgi:acyl-coenzyme A synthetase/AMP-(fatty) acid ligase